METIMVLIQAAILGLLVVGGFWLRHFVSQQLAAKDSIIQLKDAEIARLTKLSVPAVAADMEAAARLVNRYAQAKAEAEREVNELRRQAPMSSQYGLATGLLEGFSALLFIQHDALMKVGLSIRENRIASAPEVLEQLKPAMETLLESIDAVNSGQQPTLKYTPLVRTLPPPPPLPSLPQEQREG